MPPTVMHPARARARASPRYCSLSMWLTRIHPIPSYSPPPPRRLLLAAHAPTLTSPLCLPLIVSAYPGISYHLPPLPGLACIKLHTPTHPQSRSRCKDLIVPGRPHPTRHRLTTIYLHVILSDAVTSVRCRAVRAAASTY